MRWAWVCSLTRSHLIAGDRHRLGVVESSLSLVLPRDERHLLGQITLQTDHLPAARSVQIILELPSDHQRKGVSSPKCAQPGTISRMLISSLRSNSSQYQEEEMTSGVSWCTTKGSRPAFIREASGRSQPLFTLGVGRLVVLLTCSRHLDRYYLYQGVIKVGHLNHFG